ncbi:MAG: eCIS core domain-containing protein [Longimicrobiales bacterium]
MIARLVRAVTGTPDTTPRDLPEGVAVVRGRWVPVLGGLLSGMRGHAAATTLGDTIIVHPSVELTERLLTHELEHVRQWRRQPFLFPVLYAWNHLRFGYESNPYEVEARRAELGRGTEGGSNAHHSR